MNIELRGFNGHGWRVCDNCPCNREEGCYFGYAQTAGVLGYNTGQIITETQMEIIGAVYDVAGGWYGVTIRPQECIDKHGK